VTVNLGTVRRDIIVVGASAGGVETRPAVDPLFRSAALLYGPRAVGGPLSGGDADGVSGLINIKAAGGMSIVQDPDEAAYPTMPAPQSSRTTSMPCCRWRKSRWRS
jgi:two-component system chemotaxis response regulator CheB